MKDEKLLGADAAAVDTAEPVASDQLSHAEPVMGKVECAARMLEVEGRLSLARSAMLRGNYVDFAMELMRARRLCGELCAELSTCEYFLAAPETGNATQPVSEASGSVPSEAP